MVGDGARFIVDRYGDGLMREDSRPLKFQGMFKSQPDRFLGVACAGLALGDDQLAISVFMSDQQLAGCAIRQGESGHVGSVRSDLRIAI